jgi:hypothetical protein
VLVVIVTVFIVMIMLVLVAAMVVVVTGWRAGGHNGPRRDRDRVRTGGLTIPGFRLMIG